MATTINQPRINLNISNASSPVQNSGQKILFVGQQLSGSAVPGELQVEIENGGAEDGLFGRRAMLTALIRAMKVRNQALRVDAIGLEDNVAGVDSVGAITFVGTATEAGTYRVFIASERNYTVTVPVAVGDTDEDVGDALTAAYVVHSSLPATLLNTAGAVAITARNAGTHGNSFPIGITGEIAGLTATVTGMAGGAVDPVLSNIFDVIGQERYQAIVWPYPDDTTELLALLDPRFNAEGAVRDGVGFTAKVDSFANLNILGDSLNSQSLVVFGDLAFADDHYAGPSISEIPMVTASQFAGFRALRMDVSAQSIADLVITTNGPLDGFGGPALASKPYFNTPFADLIPMTIDRGFDDAQIESLFASGISVIGNNIADNAVLAGEIVTTYKTDVAGNPDQTFKFLCYVDTATQSREYFFNNLRARFAQSRLTDGDVQKGRDMANEQVIRSFCKRLYQDLASVDFVLMRDGEDALNFYQDNLIVALDLATGLVTIQSKNPIVTQLRQFNMDMKLVIDTLAA